MNTLILNPGSRWLKGVVYTSEGEVVETKKILIDDTDGRDMWISELADIGKIGLRVVHGGGCKSPILLDETVRANIEEFSVYAPLHNPLTLALIDGVRKYFSKISIYCVFDTHFHRSLAPEEYTYPIDAELAQKYGIRRYGFHGVALESVYAQFENEFLQRGEHPPQKLIMVHLGGGSSVTAVVAGRSVSTSMGLTPLDGAMMITRSGSIDPDIFSILNKKAGMDVDTISEMLTKRSGFYAMTNSTDTKQIIDDAIVGKQPDALAFSMYIRSIIKNIFAMYGVMQGTDALIFSGGIGFNNEYVRSAILEKIEILGLHKENVFMFQADEARVIFKKIQDLP